MLKIVDVHLSSNPNGEYVVLQNQGLITVSLRGWALCSEKFMEGDPYAASPTTFIFSDDVPIKPYGRVVLFTGSGHTGWQPTIDGKQAYVVYWNRPDHVWQYGRSVHLLFPSCCRNLPQQTEAVPFG